MKVRLSDVFSVAPKVKAAYPHLQQETQGSSEISCGQPADSMRAKPGHLVSTIVIDMSGPQLLKLSRHVESNGTVVVFEEGTVPFEVKRCFVVTATKGQVRGEHAHRQCSQLLVALSGRILVTVDDGLTEREFRLTDVDHGLLVPPMNWATQVYLSDESRLLVVCDDLYREEDYIRSYEAFKQLMSA